MNRRKFLAGAGLASSAALGAGMLAGGRETIAQIAQRYTDDGSASSDMRAAGTTSTSDFDPYAFATRFNWGDEIEDLGDGRKLRRYFIDAVDKEIEVAPGVRFPCWTYNGQVPGPTLRANEGDEIEIRFRNDGSHPHTIHFHGIHRPEVDGIPGVGDGMIETGDETVYDFTAEPYGTHLYHCHSTPLKRHIHKGLYGAFIVDPAGGYDEMLGQADREFVMVMNGFDTNFDGDNEIYAVNTKAFCYAERPLEVTQDELVRIHLVNTTEFDPINSFHLHAHFFDYYDTGRIENRRTWVDTIMQCQAQRGILQFRAPFPGKLMFHAHQSEFAELGWLGFFDVQAKPGVEEEGTYADSEQRGPADPRYGDDEAVGGAVLDEASPKRQPAPEPQPVSRETTHRTAAGRPVGTANTTPDAGATEATTSASATSPETSSTREAIERVIEDAGGALR